MLETTGYILLGILAVVWIAAILFGLIAAFPFGLLGLMGLLGVGLLLIKVIKERLNSEEDDYYSRNVEK